MSGKETTAWVTWVDSIYFLEFWIGDDVLRGERVGGQCLYISFFFFKH